MPLSLSPSSLLYNERERERTVYGSAGGNSTMGVGGRARVQPGTFSVHASSLNHIEAWLDVRFLILPGTAAPHLVPGNFFLLAGD